MASAAIVHAGAQGIEEGLSAPPPTEEDLSFLPPEVLAARGFVRLPTTLDAALDRFEASEIVKGWFPPHFASVYRAHKSSEMAHVASMDIAGKCAAYEDSY